jgi:Na+-driven multidrug efflux pump
MRCCCVLNSSFEASESGGRSAHLPLITLERSMPGRGMGRQGLVAALNLVGFWVVGLRSVRIADFPTRGPKMLLTFHACSRSVGAWATFYAPVPGGGTGLGIAGLWWGLGAGLFSTCSCGAFLLSRTDWTERAAKISRSRAASNTDGAGEP